MDIPNDDNGRVLRHFVEKGDDLSRARIVEFFHIFPMRAQALAFAEAVPEEDYSVTISFYEERDCWDVTVSRLMALSHAEVTKIEVNLAASALNCEGRPDGWQAQFLGNEPAEQAGAGTPDPSVS